MNKALSIVGLLLICAYASGANEDIQKACPAAAKYFEDQSRDAKESTESDQSVPTRPELRDELVRMANADQEVRKSLPKDAAAASAALKKIDAPNLARLKAIVSEVGFPRRALVGDEGVDAAWLLVQHAWGDAEFQEHMLEKITPLVKSGEISNEQFALLTDRVLIHENKPQRYGSQVYFEKNSAIVKPIEDAEHVDQRRAGLGMMPLSDYLCVSKVVHSRTSK